MTTQADGLTINYEEDGVVLVKQLDKEILSKGAWTTIIFRYQDWDRRKEEYGPERFTIRRYQKVGGKYLPKSKFNISSAEQARKLIDTLQRWIDEPVAGNG